MNDNSDKSRLDLLLAKALKQYSPHANVPERTAVEHLAKQLENEVTDVDFRIQRVNGILSVECTPIAYTQDKRLKSATPRKKP